MDSGDNMKKLVYVTLTKKSSWPKEWQGQYEEFREHWQEFKQLMGKDLPGRYLATKINHNLVLAVVAVKNEHDVYNVNKCLKVLQEDYPNRKIVHISDLDLDTSP